MNEMEIDFPAIKEIDTDAVRLEAKFFRYDEHLDRAADLFESDPQAWLKLPVQLQDASGLYRDRRTLYRKAVDRGVIPDDRGPSAA